MLSALFKDAANYWCIASVVDNLMIMEHHCNDTDRGKTVELGEIPKYRFVDHKSQMLLSGIEIRPPRQKIGGLTARKMALPFRRILCA